MTSRYHPGQPVVYRRPKHSTSPGPRAKHIHPAEHGDAYSYDVEKFWIVNEVRDDGTLIVRTRTGKTHEVKQHDPLLRPASFWERWWHRNRFPSPPGSEGT